MINMERFEKALFILFSVLFFVTPLIFWPFTSEIFEFNKIVAIYSLTTLIVTSWILRMITAEKIIFRRTLIDIPLLVFLGTQVLATIFSVDTRTSIFGYYSRFNGGLLSTICYCLLYWAFVSNVSFEKAKKLILILLTSATIVSFIGVLEHSGVNLTCSPIRAYGLTLNPAAKDNFNNLGFGEKVSYLTKTNCWVQDVKYRVFSTLGQPNWLGTFLAALIPLTWALSLKHKWKSKNFLYSITLSSLFLIVLLFTKSRSALLGFLVAAVIFWGLSFWKKKKEVLNNFLFNLIPIVAITLVIGTQFTPNIKEVLTNSSNAKEETPNTSAGPALEVGGTESGEIRKIIWKGAVELWKAYPLIGSGVETFAYTYYQTRPAQHNLVSEWDFVYNKAHNEYLNFAANTGLLGILSYLSLIGVSVFTFFKLGTKNSSTSEEEVLTIGLMAGYISILISNFFGFSVAITQLQLFLFPAFAIALSKKGQTEDSKLKDKSLDAAKWLGFIFVLGISLYILISILRYWRADLFYAKAKDLWRQNNYPEAIKNIDDAIKISPNESLYHLEKSVNFTDSAVLISGEEKTEEALALGKMAINEANIAQRLSPRNVNIKRTVFTMYIKLSIIDPNYLVNAGQTLQEAIVYAPTNAKFLYNLALIYARIGKTEEAIKTIEKTIELKSNYKDARLAYALILIDIGENEKAKKELEYILSYIDPEDVMTKQTLEELK